VAENKNLKKLAKKSCQKSHIQCHPVHDTYCTEKTRFAKLLKETKETHWNEYLENVSEGTEW